MVWTSWKERTVWPVFIVSPKNMSLKRVAKMPAHLALQSTLPVPLATARGKTYIPYSSFLEKSMSMLTSWTAPKSRGVGAAFAVPARVSC